MKKIGLILFLVAAVFGILFAKMFSWGSMPAVHMPSISFNSSVKGSGNVITETRDVSGFNSVDAGGAFLVEIVAGKEYSVQIQADDNLVPLITTRVNGETLELDSEKRLSTRNRIKIVITAPRIEEIKASGASHFKVTGIDNESLTIDTGGASQISVSGKAKRLEVDMGGASQVNAFDLAVENASVDGGGASFAKVNATGELLVDLGGASRLQYSGSPKNIEKKTSGASSIRQVD